MLLISVARWRWKSASRVLFVSWRFFLKYLFSKGLPAQPASTPTLLGGRGAEGEHSWKRITTHQRRAGEERGGQRRTAGRQFSSSWMKSWCRLHPNQGCSARAPCGDGREKRVELLLGQEQRLSAALRAAVCCRAGLSCSTEPPALGSPSSLGHSIVCSSASRCPGRETWAAREKGTRKKIY